MNVKINKKKYLKHFYYTLNKEYIEVKCNNNLSSKEILNILKQNITSITKKYNNLIKTPSLEEFEQILYKGSPLHLKITINSNLKYESFKLNENSIELFLNSKFTIEKKEIIRDTLYKTFAKQELLPRVYFWQKITNLEANKISFRKAKSRWGSCSSINNISLNSRLLMLPQTLIDYVIVHELAHIVHKNHSKAFWSLVEKFYPNYKEARKELKKYGALLS